MIKSKLFLLLLLQVSCVTIPQGLTAVEDFEINRYLGKWYEIARLDHSFERGLTDVTASYELRDDGGIDVTNRGFDPTKNKWKEAKGKAYFVDQQDVGMLKVSFFGPFYGGYNIIALDTDRYSYSLVVGPSRDYLWILAREPQLPEEVLEMLLTKAKQLQFEIDKLIFVTHDKG